MLPLPQGERSSTASRRSRSSSAADASAWREADKNGSRLGCGTAELAATAGKANNFHRISALGRSPAGRLTGLGTGTKWRMRGGECGPMYSETTRSIKVTVKPFYLE